jgi:hypothetical protein
MGGIGSERLQFMNRESRLYDFSYEPGVNPSRPIKKIMTFQRAFHSLQANQIEKK